jgi:hypothetical protein
LLSLGWILILCARSPNGIRLAPALIVLGCVLVAFGSATTIGSGVWSIRSLLWRSGVAAVATSLGLLVLESSSLATFYGEDFLLLRDLAMAGALLLGAAAGIALLLMRSFSTRIPGSRMCAFVARGRARFSG